MKTEMLNIEFNTDELTKSTIKDLANQTIDNWLSNGIDIIRIAEIFAKYENFIKAIKDDERYLNYLLEELAKYHGCFVSHTGTKIESSENGTRYDFNGCNDPEYNELKNELDVIKEKVTAREEFLKHLPKEGMEVICKTKLHGEVVAYIYPPLKQSKSGYKITIRK